MMVAQLCPPFSITAGSGTRRRARTTVLVLDSYSSNDRLRGCIWGYHALTTLDDMQANTIS
jgi:hypothetical protein